MSSQPPVNVGANYVPAYQLSGVPWVSGSSFTGYVRIDFPHVTRWIVVKNLGTDPMSFGFNLAGVSSSAGDLQNHFTVPANTLYGPFELRCKHLFLSGTTNHSYEILAGLTTIVPENFPELTGSGIG